jgi:Na+/H+-dicarboxylate symporter
LIVTFINYKANGMMSQLWKNTLKYTLSTTYGAALVSFMLYLIIKPRNMVMSGVEQQVTLSSTQVTYLDYLKHLIPSNFIQPFLENQVLTVLVLAVLVGLALRQIPDQLVRKTVADVFKGLHGIFMVLTKWLLLLIPLGLFGFITTSIESMHGKHALVGLSEYLAVIVLANIIQAFIILPIWLRRQGIKPYTTMKALIKPLSVAFFSKSSIGTLPLTMDTVEQRLNISPEISRFVLPLCTSVNMNGCAAFIFTTVIYLQQNAGQDVSLISMLTWTIIASIAAIGNAGVPMGCFFLSISLLVSMNVPITLLGVILPFYALIDMIETALNVWSDCCVVSVVNLKKIS